MVLRPARHITGHFRDESFQAITCSGTDNTKQTGENTQKTHTQKQKINKLGLGKKNTPNKKSLYICKNCLWECYGEAK